MNKINALELWMLKRFCDEHGLDYQEIDNTLTYYENKSHLKELRTPPDFFDAHFLKWAGYLKEENDEIKSMEEWYMKNYILEDYIAAALAGETRSTEVGKPYYPKFSLAAFIAREQ